MSRICCRKFSCILLFMFMPMSFAFGMIMTFEEESGIENDKYGVVEDEGVMEKKADEKREKAEMRFERAEASKTNRAIINDVRVFLIPVGRFRLADC